MSASNWRSRLIEAVVLLAATTLFSIFCILPLVSMQGNPSLQSELGVRGGESPPPPWMLPFDDSYIFIRYAQQAHRGHPLQWNTGEPSSGASSFLYPWILLPGQWFSEGIAGWSWWSRLVGCAALWALGLVTALLIRTLGLTGPWPLAGAVAVVWSGPVGFGALTGMESAINAAALLWAVALWIRLSQERRPLGASILATLLALLPLLRPENLLLTLIAAVAILLLPRTPLPRWTAPLLLLPGVAVALLNLQWTGLAQPTAVVTKSWLGIAYPEPLTLIRLYLLGLWTEILPVYSGSRGFLLWPPVGLVALATAIAGFWGLPREILRRDREAAAWQRALRPLALVWLVLLALAPMSSMPGWQGMRHHHSGLVCAWLLAMVGLGLFMHRPPIRLGSLAPLSRLSAFAPALLLLFFLPNWGGIYSRSAIEIHHRHGPAVAWLEQHPGEVVLLLNDAGILSLAHDGPAIDVMGLGTPEMARAYRHGAGAMIEAVARRRPLPVLAAANLDVFRLGELLSDPLIEGLDPEDQTVVTEIELALLEDTVLEGRGIDFAQLDSEAAAQLRWRPAPDPYLASFALKLTGPDGKHQLQGCRPVAGRIEIGIPPDAGPVLSVAAPLATSAARIRSAFVTRDGEVIEASEGTLAAGRWTTSKVVAPRGSRWFRFESVPGEPTACLESVTFQ